MTVTAESIEALEPLIDSNGHLDVEGQVWSTEPREFALALQTLSERILRACEAQGRRLHVVLADWDGEALEPRHAEPEPDVAGRDLLDWHAYRDGGY